VWIRRPQGSAGDNLGMGKVQAPNFFQTLIYEINGESSSLKRRR